MTSPKINILYLPYNNAGGHFVDWSILFVSGQNKYVNHNGQINDLIVDPDTKNNRNLHAHNSVMAAGLMQLQEKVKLVQNAPVSVVNIYCTLATHNPILKKLYGPDCTLDNSTIEQRDQVDQMINQDNADMLAWIEQQNFSLMFIDYVPKDVLSIVYNDRFPAFNDKPQGTVDQLWTNTIKTFYDGIEQYFDDHVWDRREMFALSLHPVKYNPTLPELIDASRPHLYYNTDAIWNDMPACLPEMCDFLGLSVDAQRFELWREQYRHWREKHDIGFARDFDRIIHNIIHNKWMSLKRYKLDFLKEVLIQRALIQQHNVNLKTWQLEKFPDNTQDLHALLEPNIHPKFNGSSYLLHGS